MDDNQMGDPKTGEDYNYYNEDEPELSNDGKGYIKKAPNNYNLGFEDKKETKKREVKKYVFHKEFEDRKTYQIWFQMEEIKKNFTATKKRQQTEYWVCQHSRKKGFNCKFSYVMKFNGNYVVVKRSEIEHNHKASGETSMPCKVEILALYDRGFKTPLRIHAELYV
jgi:hypothetical protein